MFAAATVAALAFSPQLHMPVAHAPPARATAPAMTMAGRRAALLAGAAAATTFAMPAFADSVEDIAARNAAAAAAARETAANTPEVEEDKSSSVNLVAGVLVGSVALSVPFYWCAEPARGRQPRAFFLVAAPPAHASFGRSTAHHTCVALALRQEKPGPPWHQGCLGRQGRWVQQVQELSTSTRRARARWALPVSRPHWVGE